MDVKDKIVDPNEENIALAAQLIRSGGCVVCPSDTNMGLAVDPWNEEAVLRPFAIKHRPADSPLTLFIDDPRDWVKYASVDAWEADAINAIASSFWPGPLKIVMPKRSAVVPDYLTCGKSTVAISCVSNGTTNRLVRAVGHPIAMTSANLHGQAKSQLIDVALAAEQIGDKVDLILRGEAQGTTCSTTIVSVDNHACKIVRHGDITEAQIHAALEKKSLDE